MLFIIGLLLGALVVIFALQNLAPVTVSLFAWEFEGSLALIVILAMLSGIIVSMLVSIPSAIRNSLRLSRLASQNQRLASELSAHKQALTETEVKLAEKDRPVVVEKTTVIEPTRPNI